MIRRSNRMLDDSPHPSPRRMIFVTVQGEYQITASGETRRFPAGSVLVAEDTTGVGHSTKIINGSGDVIIFAVNLPAAC